MDIRILTTAIRLLWMLMEVAHLRRQDARPTKDWDHRSRHVWDAANALELIGIILGFTSIGHIQGASPLIGYLGLGLLLIGITIRWTAIYTLGKYFTGTVLIRDDHQLIRRGLYKHLRHPSYTGALIAHLGLGLSFVNWFSLGFSSIPFLIAVFFRMHVEEQALHEAFGADYTNYASQTKRLIPKVY